MNGGASNLDNVRRDADLSGREVSILFQTGYIYEKMPVRAQYLFSVLHKKSPQTL